jgi:kumamolisin
MLQSISGLNDAIRWQRPSAYKKYLQQPGKLQAGRSCPRRSNSYYTPDQIAKAYNATPFYGAHDYGEGQNIALFELSSFSLADIHAYTACFGQSHTAIRTIATSTQPMPADASRLEVEMDAELTLSMAPHLGALSIYLGENNAAGYLAEWAQIVQDAVPIVSTSWGACERAMDPQVIRQENTLLKLAVLQGQTVFASSGDSGSAGCLYDDTTSPTSLTAEDPATQPYLTSVGGSTLSPGRDGSYGKEVVWNDPTDVRTSYNGGASGGGISQYWTASTWQQAPGVSAHYASDRICHAPPGTHCRQTPDIALHADPYKGYLIYCTAVLAGCDAKQPWMATGGTSAATPVWAAFQALFNVLALRSGGFNLGFLNPLLYQLASQTARYKTDFHDITSGDNDFNHLNKGNYLAAPGYDLATGLGSCNAFALANDLIALARHERGHRSIPSKLTWYFAGGIIGGGSQERLTIVNPNALLAHFSVTYLMTGQTAQKKLASLAPGERLTLNINTDLAIPDTAPARAVSLIVQGNNAVGLLKESSHPGAYASDAGHQSSAPSDPPE